MTAHDLAQIAETHEWGTQQQIDAENALCDLALEADPCFEDTNMRAASDERIAAAKTVLGL